MVPVSLWFDLTQDNISDHEINVVSETRYSVSGFTSVLHYGQSIFEGLKAYRLENGEVGIFRLEDHARRFKRSAEIMGMPAFDEELFISCVKKYVETCRDMVPKEEGHSLYLRPLMYATDEVIKVKSSDKYRFMILSSIVGPYFSSGKEGVSLYCNQNYTRAFPFGTGEAKTAANYALSLPHMRRTQSLGYEQTLYLDANTHSQLEELGGMNIFLLKGNTLTTPELKGTILKGVTRDSILQVAKLFDLNVEERAVKLEEILNPGDELSLFACGTAATIVPILEIGFDLNGKEELMKVQYPQNATVLKIREHLINTQHNMTSSSKQWLTIV